MNSIPRLAGFLAGFSLFIAPLAAEPLEEIIVTADLRAATLGSLPSSITVLDSAAIADVGLTHFEELSHSIPNLNFAGGSNRPRYFQIRGVGERSQYEGAPNPSVGFLVDGVDLSAIGGVALTWDVEQVEVLRGPQGTRLGANAIAGLINVESRKPTGEFGGRLRLLRGGDDARAVGLAVNSAEFGATRARLSAYSYEANGFRDNPFLARDDTNGRQERDVRARIAHRFSEASTIDLSLFYVDVDNGYDAFALDNGFTTLSDRPGRDAQRTRALSARFEHAFASGLTFNWLTTAARSDIRFSFDADWGNEDSWAPFVYDFISERRRIRENYSQEFRWVAPATETGFSWLAGIYAATLREDLNSVDGGIIEVDPVDGEFTVDTRISSDYAAENLAAFAQFDFNLAPALSLSTGLRLERRDADYVDSNGLDVGPAESMWGGHLRLTHQFDGSASLYASVSRGYKAGGFNLGQVPDGRRTFGGESVVSAEIGTNVQLLSDRWSLRAAIFYDKRSDQQISTSEQLLPGDPSSFVFFIDNAASGVAYGLELESEFRITESLRWRFNLGTLETRVDLASGDGNVDGRAQAHAPPYTFATSLNYENSAGWFAGLNLTGKDRFFFSDGHDQRSSAYQLLSARAGYRSENWEISLWGRNLADERYAVRGFFFGNEPPDFADTNYVRLGDRRQTGVNFDWRF